MFKKITKWAKALFASTAAEYEAKQSTKEKKQEVQTPKRSNLLNSSDWDSIERAMEQDQSLTCQVLACKKGGYTVSVLGTYAFMPNALAHYSTHPHPQIILGKALQVKVNSINNGQIIVSHKDALQEKFSNLIIGEVCNAVVSKILQGRLLVYIPDNEMYATVAQMELSWSLEDTIANYRIGQNVQVRIIKANSIDKIRASIRQAIELNPYEKCINDYKVGDIVTGKVQNVLQYAAFIVIDTGIVGFLHQSEICWENSILDVQKALRYGDVVKAVVCRIDRELGRLYLSLKRLNVPDLNEYYKAGSTHIATITKVMDKEATLQFPYGVTSPVKLLRLAKADISPTVEKEIMVRIISFNQEGNELHFALMKN